MDVNLFKATLERFVNKDCTLKLSDGEIIEFHLTTFHFYLESNYMICFLDDLELTGEVTQGKLIYLSSYLEEQQVTEIRTANLSFELKSSYLKLDNTNQENWEIVTLPKGTVLYRIASKDAPFDSEIIFTAERLQGEYKTMVQLASGSSLEDKNLFKLKTLEDVKLVKAKVWRDEIFNYNLAGNDWTRKEEALMQACIEVGACGWMAKVNIDNGYCDYEDAQYETVFKNGSVNFEIVSVAMDVKKGFDELKEMQLRF